MTNLEAADELERISRVCTTTKLSIAAMMGANLLRAQEPDTTAHDCGTCRHKDRMPNIYPCSECSGGRDMWEGR